MRAPPLSDGYLGFVGGQRWARTSGFLRIQMGRRTTMKWIEAPPKGSPFYGKLNTTSAVVSKKSSDDTTENSDGEPEEEPRKEE